MATRCDECPVPTRQAEWLDYAPSQIHDEETTMADITLKRAHQLGLKGARAAADKMAEKLNEKFDLAGASQSPTRR
jgi:predicted Zn-dependent protease